MCIRDRLVQGIADLVLVYPDHLELLDYKTDCRKAESDFLRAYRAQLNLYAIAIEKRFAPKKVTYKGIYLSLIHICGTSRTSPNSSPWPVS